VRVVLLPALELRRAIHQRVEHTLGALARALAPAWPTKHQTHAAVSRRPHLIESFPLDVL
jgi:hypothetical protein